MSTVTISDFCTLPAEPYTTATLWPQYGYYDYSHKCCGTGPTPS